MIKIDNAIDNQGHRIKNPKGNGFGITSHPNRGGGVNRLSTCLFGQVMLQISENQTLPHPSW